MSRPIVTYESVTFSDGTTISIDPTDIVVLVGPNNAGKSLALRELESFLSNNSRKTVIHNASLRKSGSAGDFDNYIRDHLLIKESGGSVEYSGYKFGVGLGLGTALSQYWPNDIGMLHGLFCLHLSTETRITGSNPASAIAVLDEAASHPIHMLYSNDKLEHRISEYFQRAFGEALILFRAGGRELPLLVGERLVPECGEDRISSTYCERLIQSTVPLIEQGDGMRSFASVILHLLAPITPSILILDEPEAFLHPPQARVLGEIIATERSNRAQLFVATHSPDVLYGLVNVAPESLRVLRIQREGDVNRISELDKDHVKDISTDPLMKYSSVMSGVFHERVIICESDADCMFYNSILELSEVHGDKQPDVLFVHANGKHRLAALARALKALGVPVDIIADMDILNDLSVFKRTIEELGANWNQIGPLAQHVKTAIEQRRPPIDAAEIRESIEEVLSRVPPSGEFPTSLRKEIDSVFRGASPWDVLKSAGESAIPSGQPTQEFQELKRICKDSNLWIVPVGELEGFCKSIGSHGPGWVQHVLENRDLAIDTELDTARRFVREIWIRDAD